MIIIKHRKSADVVLLRVDAARLDDRDLSGSYLLGAGMAGLSARRVLLREANLRNADLRAVDFAGADLSGAVLRNADLREADLSTAVFVDADLRGADLRRANLCGANLSRAQLFEADLSGIRCDAQSVWPVGEAWGLIARPTVEPEYPVPQFGLDVRQASARRWLLAPQRTHALGRGVLASRGRVAGMGAAALALALLVAVLADRGSDRGARTANRPTSSPRVAVRAPEVGPTTSTPEKRPEAVPATRPIMARQPAVTLQAPPQVQIRTAPTRGVRGESERPVRLARRAAPLRPSSDLNPSGGGGSTRTRASHRLVVLNSPPARSRRPLAADPVTVGETPAPVESPVVEPVVTPTVAATPVAATLARPTSRPAPWPRKIAEAWGNRDFHYGSGYDIYTMHLGQRPE